MAQHDYVIDNDTAANVRSDINGALASIASNNSAATAPATTYANQWWYDTSTDILKIRAEANDAWINVAYLDQATDQFFPFVGGVALTATGTELNVLDGITATTAELNVLDGITGMASQAVAEAGTDNATLMTPLRVAQAIDAQASSGGVTAVSAQTFTAPGTWTKPASVKFVKVTVVGGGAPGVTNPGGPGIRYSSGGGGGGTGIKYIPGPSLPGPVAVTRGAVSSTSSFGAFVSATGGANTGPLAGGTATGADIGIPGTAGGFGGGELGHGGPSSLGGGGAGNQSSGGGYGGGGAGVITEGTGPSPAPPAPGGAGSAGVVIVEVFE
jgi:hypothetical protein